MKPAKTLLTGLLIIICVSGVLYAAPPAPTDVQIEFRVKWDGRIIPDIIFVSELKKETEVIAYRSGQGQNSFQRSPGTTEYQPIILKRPRSNDTSFESWANKINYIGGGPGSEVSLRDFRKDMIIELVAPSGQVVMAFRVYRCWPSEYISLTTLDTSSNDPTMEILELQHEGWERDYSIH